MSVLYRVPALPSRRSSCAAEPGDCRRDIINEVAVEDRCFGSFKCRRQTKSGEEAQTGPAKYLATSAIMSKGHYSFEAQCSLPCLTTAASAHQPDQSFPDQKSPNIMAPNHLLGDWAQSSITKTLVHIQNLAGNVQVVGTKF